MNEKIQDIFRLCLQVQARGKGTDGYPYVKFVMANYGESIRVDIQDDGFVSAKAYDGVYEFSHDFVSERTYNNCINHLKDLLETKGVKA